MNRSLLLFLCSVLAAGIAVTVSCGGDDSGGDEKDCPVGTENCPCVNNSCNANLVCEAGKCTVPHADSDNEKDSEPEVIDTTPEGPTQSDIAITNDGEGKICAEGVVVGPVDNDSWSDHWGAGFGINLCQEASNGDKIPLGECPRDLSRLVGFRLTVTGTLPSELRIQFEDNFAGSDEIVGDNGYIVADVSDEPSDYLFADAAVFYLPEDDRPALQPELFTSVQFQIASHLGETEEFDFCIQDIEVVLGNGDADAGVDDTDTGADVPEMTTDTDPACADPDSLKIIPADNSWVAGCSNAAHVQGDLYQYSDAS